MVIYLLIYLFIYLPVYLFIHLFTYSNVSGRQYAQHFSKAQQNAKSNSDIMYYCKLKCKYIVLNLTLTTLLTIWRHLRYFSGEQILLKNVFHCDGILVCYAL